jgi:predicted transglutaminase-like cysteine proteinase
MWVRGVLSLLSLLVLVFAAPQLAVAGQIDSISTTQKYVKPLHNQLSAEIFGKSLPPVGYVKFCGLGQDECRFANGSAEKLHLTQEKWDQISQVNSYVQTKIRPVSDMELYGMPDKWTYPTKAGDCEDFVLLKKRYLLGMGFSPDVMLVTVVLDENGEGHAVLSLVTDKGDYVLDNRRNEVLRWDETGYTYLKRQSQFAATSWESLQPSRKPVMVSTKSN